MSVFKDSNGLYQVQMKTINAGIVVSDGMVVGAAPVLRKSVGLSIGKVRKWVEEKGGKIVRISSGEK
jgi:hypothetical protein